MPYDITLCSGEGCPVKKYCERSTLEVLGRQDFFGTVPFDTVTRDCRFFYENETFRSLQREKAYQLWQQAGEQHGKDLQHWQEARQAVFYYLANHLASSDSGL